MLQIIVGFWTWNLISVSIITYFEESFQGDQCIFENYFTPMVILLITLVFTIISMTTFICYICIFTKILKEWAKHSLLGKLRSVNIMWTLYSINISVE